MIPFDREDFRKYVPGAQEFFYELILYNPYIGTLETLLIPPGDIWEAYEAARDEGLEAWIPGLTG